ncbi:MAG: transglutaminase family protein [Rhodobacteraceae bacterium]|nr:transglutaminase family protein [Paracoccaceae bacterium]
MILEIMTKLDYTLPKPCDLLMQLEVAEMHDQTVLSAKLETNETEHFATVPAEDRIGTRTWLRASERLTISYQARVQVDRAPQDISKLAAVPPHLLPGEVVKYLMASRYCPSDQFLAFTDAEFGHLKGGARIAAMRDWIERAFAYVPGVSNSKTTGLDTFVQRQGICRDFAHVLITLARASAIPARMVSAYGIGVEPQDFHALVDVYLDGSWYPVDPTGMVAPGGLARIGVGRDAADISFLTAYGALNLETQSVDVREAGAD